MALGFSSIVMAGGNIAPVAPAPVVSEPVDSWSGLYAGLQVGGVWGDADVDYDNTGSGFGIYRTYDLDVDGFSGGVYGGYNWLLDNDLLVGVEGEWNYVDADDSGPVTNTQGVFTKVEQNWDASLRLRAGMVMEDFMPYLTGGVAWGDFDVTVTDGSVSYSTSMTLTGWTIGAGVEKKLSEDLYTRIQYRYTDYGDDTERFYDNGETYLDGKLDYNAHMLTLGISYRF